MMQSTFAFIKQKMQINSIHEMVPKIWTFSSFTNYWVYVVRS